MKKPETHAEAIEGSNIQALPDWIHPASSDHEWFVPKTGHSVNPALPPNSKQYIPVKFDYKFCDGSVGTDPIWALLINDMKSSCIALIDNSIAKRPNALTPFTRTTFEVIDHALELKMLSGEARRILTLSDLNIDTVKSFIHAHDLATLGIDLDALNASLGRMTRSAKNINSAIASMNLFTITEKVLIQKLKKDTADSKREHNSSLNAKNSEKMLSISTIDNKLANLSYLHATKEHQLHAFEIGRHEISDIRGSVSHAYVEKKQTPLMPIEVALHHLNHAIKFHRDYAPALRSYIGDLDSYYARNILAYYSKSSIKSNVHIYKQRTYDAVPMPPALEALNIKTYGKCSQSRGKLFSNVELRDHISTDELITFYGLTTQVLIHTFTACRNLSARLLDEDCLTVSKLDGLFDIKMKIPKASNSNELEIVKRPIPKIIWDFIYEYINFTADRHPNMTSIWPSESGRETDRGEVTARKHLDQYSDWIEVPIIDQKRWYVRQHQFRRFFAAFYFYLSEGTDIETLRWMMGHIEPSETLYYANITNEPGWELDTLEFLVDFIEGRVGKDVLVDDDLENELSKKSLKVKLGDASLLREHLRGLVNHRQVKIKILNDNKIFLYGSK